MFKFSRLVGWLQIIVSIVFLSSCGGGESEKPSPKSVIPTTYQISGGGVKGPLQNAKVSLYVYDQTVSTGYGALVTVGNTNELTEITGIEISGSLENYYILSFESTNETIDISTQMSPIVPRFDTIISSADILSGQAIYASPLSSLALALVQQKVSSGVPIDQAMSQSNLAIKSIFGFGISTNTSLFNSPSLLIASADSFEEQLEIFQLRKAIEVFSTLSFQLKETLNNADLSMQSILESIAKDIIDGQLDGASTHADQLPYNIEQLDIFKQSIYDLTLPNTNNILIGSLNTLMIAEASLLHSETLNTESLRTELSLNNQDQIIFVVDYDDDGIVNAEDVDDDNDGFEDHVDAFPYSSNEWLDTDLDGIGNNADPDDDNDDVVDNEDAFPLDSTESKDFDGDGLGNNADLDDDGDNVVDTNDVFPFDATESADTDTDGLGNNLDTDDENDQVLDIDDAFPLDSTESLDSENDGLGDNSDLDDDNDGVFDISDDFPLDASESKDTDSDGLGDNADTDDDNDGVADGLDSFPLDENEQHDTDSDGIGNNADLDDDNDGQPDVYDFFPFDPSEIADNDSDGFGNNIDLDDDNDGVLDIDDAMPFDSTESVDTDLDGIGNNADPDDDNDSFLDQDDAFPYDANEWLDTDEDGMGNNTDSDDDNDGIYDNDDELPLDASESLDFDKDMIGDVADSDDDNDGINDDLDNIHISVPTQSQFNPEDLINFNIRGFYTDGSILSGNDKWHIQYQVFDVNLEGVQVPFYSENGYYNANFNQAKNEWNVSFPVPDYSGNFEVKFVLYCSTISDICGNHNNKENYFQKEQSILFKVNCLSEPCGYQPEQELGKNISASQTPDYLTTSVVRSNGDIIAIYLDQTENNWKNYVVKSTDNGYSWNRIGQLPNYVLDGHMIELSQNEQLLIIGSCGTSFCLYSSLNGESWMKQDLFKTSTFANCIDQNCDTNYMSISDIIEAEDGALMVMYNSRVDGKEVPFMTKSYDRVNWSSPVDSFGSDYTTIVHSLIKMDNQRYAAAVVSYEDYQLTIFTSDGGDSWLPLKSFSLIDSADLTYQNGTLRLFYQKNYKIFETYSSDFTNFSIPEKIVEKSYIGFDAVPLSNGGIGVIYNLYLNYKYDVFYQDVSLNTP
jgi:hypothetical protein